MNVAYTSNWFSTLSIPLQKHVDALSHHPFAKHDAYANVFSDFIMGNQTLFPSNNEIMATWSLIDKIKEKALLPKPYLLLHDLLKG